MNEVQDYAQELLKLRRWWSSNPPFNGHAAPIDLMLFLVARYDNGRGARLKDVYRSLGHSESNIRRYLRFMERDGWVVIHKDDGDMRNHIAVPTRRMLAAFREYALHAKRLTDRITPDSVAAWAPDAAVPEPVAGHAAEPVGHSGALA